MKLNTLIALLLITFLTSCNDVYTSNELLKISKKKSDRVLSIDEFIKKTTGTAVVMDEMRSFYIDFFKQKDGGRFVNENEVLIEYDDDFDYPSGSNICEDILIVNKEDKPFDGKIIFYKEGSWMFYKSVGLINTMIEVQNGMWKKITIYDKKESDYELIDVEYPWPDGTKEGTGNLPNKIRKIISRKSPLNSPAIMEEYYDDGTIKEKKHIKFINFNRIRDLSRARNISENGFFETFDINGNLLTQGIKQDGKVFSQWKLDYYSKTGKVKTRRYMMKTFDQLQVLYEEGYNENEDLIFKKSKCTTFDFDKNLNILEFSCDGSDEWINLLD